MQTILGAGGVIANNLVGALPKFTDQIRLVARNPKAVLGHEALFPADLTDPAQVRKAVAGSEIVYLTVGFPYSTKVWQTLWPPLMRSVIDACKAEGAKLVFFSNVYALGKVAGKMTEETPMKPNSKKGTVRAEVEQMLLDAVSRGELQAMIVRGADFYGPHTPLSFVNAMIFDNLAKGKTAQLLVSGTTRHSLTFTPDAGKATALLGNTPSAYNQIWNAPTHPDALNMNELVDIAAAAFGVPNKKTVLAKWMIRMAGWFNGIIGESVEMLYQNENDYLFDSSKFQKAFPDFPVTNYRDGIAQTVASYKI